MPSYTGLFRANAKKKITMECFNDTLPKAVAEFEEYAKHNNLVFIRAYKNTEEKPKKEWAPSIKNQVQVLNCIRNGFQIDPFLENTFQYLLDNGQIVKKRKGGYRVSS